MTALSDLRDRLIADLAPLGVPVYATPYPDEFTPPCAFVMPPLAGSYVIPAPTFREYTAALDVLLLTEHGPAAGSLAELEALTEAALRNTMDWELQSVESPVPATVVDGGAEYLSTVIHLSQIIRL